MAWGSRGIAVSQMASLPCAIFLGEKYDSNMTSIVPLHPDYCTPLLTYGLSGELAREVRVIDSSLKPTNSSFEKVAFDLAHWTAVAAEKYPNGLPKPYTDDPTQWIFHGHPCGSVVWDEQAKWTAHGPLRQDVTVLHVAVARLLGYRWPAELDEGMELSQEQRHWVERCKTLLPHADEDGIVCIPRCAAKLQQPTVYWICWWPPMGQSGQTQPLPPCLPMLTTRAKHWKPGCAKVLCPALQALSAPSLYLAYLGRSARWLFRFD